jgi:hypothetical protein
MASMNYLEFCDKQVTSNGVFQRCDTRIVPLLTGTLGHGIKADRFALDDAADRLSASFLGASHQ